MFNQVPDQDAQIAKIRTFLEKAQNLPSLDKIGLLISELFKHRAQRTARSNKLGRFTPSDRIDTDVSIYRLLVKVKEIISTQEFTGVWRGRVFLCIAFPNASNLAIGDVVIVTRLASSSQYFYWENVVSEILFFSPGYPHTSTSAAGELWSYQAGAAPPTLRWTCPNGGESITCLFWVASAGLLYICTYRGSVAPPRLYKFDIDTNIATLITTFPSPPAVYWEASDAAEFTDGLIYIYRLPGYVYRFDPVAETLTEVWADGTGYEGGITVQNGALFVCNGYQVYTSPSGDVGSWVLDEDISTTFGVWDCGPMVTDPADGTIYLNCGYSNLLVLSRPVGGPWGIEYQEVANSDESLGLGVRYEGAVSKEPYFTGWLPASGPLLIYRKESGSWILDWSTPVGFEAGYAQMLASIAGKLYGLFWDNWDGITNRIRLYRRDGANNWTPIYEWEYYLYTENAWWMVMTIAKTSKMIHNI